MVATVVRTDKAGEQGAGRIDLGSGHVVVLGLVALEVVEAAGLAAVGNAVASRRTGHRYLGWICTGRVEAVCVGRAVRVVDALPARHRHVADQQLPRPNNNPGHHPVRQRVAVSPRPAATAADRPTQR